MKRIPVLTVVFLSVVFLFQGEVNVSAQESIDSDELKRAAGPVEFISNTARPTRIDTREQIFQLGRGPGAQVRGGSATGGSRGRYFVISRKHPEEFDKIDADIFGLGAGTSVDTITNLRLIIQGYLEAAYAYSPADAALLAEYITVYNAVYRQNRSYFETRYKTPLLADLSAGSEGLALRYDEWPGKTLMMIPLATAVPGSPSAVDTSAITDKNVVDKLREGEDKGVGTRQDMVNLKEREADAAEKAAAAARDKNAAEEKRLSDERARVAAEQKRLADEKAKVEQDKKAGADVSKREDEIKQSEAELAQAQQDIVQDAAALEASKTEEQKTAEFAEQKAAEAQSERESIAVDQRETIAAAPVQTAPPPPPGILAIRLPSGKPYGTVVKVNPVSAETMQTSSLNQVAGRTLSVVGGKTIAVATSGGKTRLIEIDPASLQMIKQGDDDINQDTQIWVSGANIYAIASDGGKNKLARFSADLGKQAQSAITVHPWAAVIFQGDRIITQNEQGAVVFLKAGDLTE